MRGNSQPALSSTVHKFHQTVKSLWSQRHKLVPISYALAERTPEIVTIGLAGIDMLGNGAFAMVGGFGGIKDERGAKLLGLLESGKLELADEYETKIGYKFKSREKESAVGKLKDGLYRIMETSRTVSVSLFGPYVEDASVDVAKEIHSSASHLMEILDLRLGVDLSKVKTIPQTVTFPISDDRGFQVPRSQKEFAGFLLGSLEWDNFGMRWDGNDLLITVPHERKKPGSQILPFAWPHDPVRDLRLRKSLEFVGWTLAVEDSGGDTIDLRLNFGETYWEDSE